MKEGPKAYTADEITEAIRTWAVFPGFTAESCGKCKRTANVLAHSAGWFCDCGHYNVQSWSHTQIPHETPDMGPTQATIRAGVSAARN